MGKKGLFFFEKKNQKTFIRTEAPAEKTDPGWTRAYPTLRREHFRDDAGVYFDRSDMLLRLAPRQGLDICEVGVGLGGFSRFLLDHMAPRRFVAIDLFDLHTKPDLWGRPPAEALNNQTHRAFYETTFAHHAARMIIEEGQSHTCLARYPAASFDIVYLDADHTYESVVRDAAAGAPLVKPGGLLVFNDYVRCDHLGHHPMGVIPAVHELIAATDWQVAGFSLQPLMYCDIALRRAGN